MATLLRTLWYLRGGQVVGQVRRALLGRDVKPRTFSGEPPRAAFASPRVPWLASPPHARCASTSRIELIHRTLESPGGAGAIDWEFSAHGPLFAYHLHQFDWARDPRLAPSERLAALESWVARHPRGVGWDSAPISLRAFAWTKLLTTPGALPAGSGEASVRASLAAQLETLAANLETHLSGNHLMWNLIALVFAGTAHEGSSAERWLALAPRLAAELREQILGSGLHYERSPMYHALLLENVLDLVNADASAPGRVPAALAGQLRETAARMLGALAVVTHPDGEIALLGDSAFGIAHPPARLRAYAAALGISPRAPSEAGVLRDAGIVRLEAGDVVCIVSAWRPWPEHQPGHAHCDALSFELSLRGERVITDTGVTEYAPGAKRELARATRSHATVEIDGREQAECWAAHRIGGRPDVALVRVGPNESVEAACAGWATPEVLHRRRFALAPDGALAISDGFDAPAPRARAFLPLAPGLAPTLAGHVATIPLRAGG
ncbi:MAG TPA: heparinase II/III family protein, partial [Myxococcota bacterium]